MLGSMFRKHKSNIFYKKNPQNFFLIERENVQTKIKEMYLSISSTYYGSSDEFIRLRAQAVELLYKNYEKPFVSVVIPFYNRAEYITETFVKTLNNLSCSDSSVEIIFIDDGSTDDTLKNLRSIVHKLRFKTYVLNKKNGGPASARNYGMKHAQGEYIFMTDSDVLVLQNWLREFLVPFLYDPLVVLVGGRQLNMSPKTIFDKWRNSRVEHLSNFFITNSVFFERMNPNDTANMAIKNGQKFTFDEHFTKPGWEDLDFGYRIKQQGKRVVFVPYTLLNMRSMYYVDYKKMMEVRMAGFKIFINKFSDYRFRITKYDILAHLFSGKLNINKLIRIHWEISLLKLYSEMQPLLSLEQRKSRISSKTK